MCPRKYDSTKRREAAAATRARILEATRAILGGKGDLGDFSLEAVARKAGVARMTVYYQFRSRAGLLESLADHLAQRGGMERMREVFLAPTLEDGLRKLVEVFVGFWASDRVTMRRLRALGVVFPDEAAGPRDRDAWRREAISNLLRRHGYRAKRASRGGDAGVIDTISALTSFEVFDLLRGRSRKSEEVVAILSTLALAALRPA
jgi:AcrR family transcriptional regulator